MFPCGRSSSATRAPNKQSRWMFRPDAERVHEEHSLYARRAGVEQHCADGVIDIIGSALSVPQSGVLVQSASFTVSTVDSACKLTLMEPRAMLCYCDIKELEEMQVLGPTTACHASSSFNG
eukprot:5288727-Amphidinium_carterae.1